MAERNLHTGAAIAALCIVGVALLFYLTLVPSAPVRPAAARGPRVIPQIADVVSVTLPAGLERALSTTVFVWEAHDLLIELAYVASGDFILGSDDEDSYPDELPRRRAVLAAPFWIGRREVSWREYRAFEAATKRAPVPAPPFGEKPDHPVVNVTWQDARAFCAWAGLGLPTEIGWERAARGTDGRKFPWGDEAPDGELCVFDGNAPFGGRSTAPCGSCPAGVSPVGALDMAGNAWEWCADVQGEKRAVRGGSYARPARLCRAANRQWLDRRSRGTDLGFRVALAIRSGRHRVS